MALLAVTLAAIQVVLPPRAVAKLILRVAAKPLAVVLPSQAVAVKHLPVAVIHPRLAVVLQSPDAAAKHPHVAVLQNRNVAANQLLADVLLNRLVAAKFLRVVAGKSLADCSPACSASARKARAANQPVAAKWLRPVVAKCLHLADVTAAAIPVATLAVARKSAADC